MRFLAFVIVTLVLLSACGQETAREQAGKSEDSASLDADAAKEIAWFNGTVDEAFAYAKETGKPVFLYWGAEWCPPCHAIKATIFNKPEFIKRSKLFVPVYLDGDHENAQANGERFGVMGYPTMIVFDAEGRELARIPNGIDIQAYANVLDLTLAASSSARVLLEGLVGGADRLSKNDCSLLAYHAWRQDPDMREDFDLSDGFRRMYEACPAELSVERSILFMSWLDELRRSDTDSGDPLELTDAQREQALAVLDAILASSAMIRANIFRVLLNGPEYTMLLTEPGSERRARMIRTFYETLDNIAADDDIYKRERIYTLAGKIAFERMDDEDAGLSEQLQQEIRDMVQWADESTPSVYERQPVINALGNVLNAAGMDDVAKPMLLAELDKSKQPYYFMVDLADIERRAGNHEAALEWLRKAYESTRGPATRFQWGRYYLFGLIEMTPEDTQAIEDTAIALITEFLRDGGGFYQRPKRHLQQVEARLLEWGDDRPAVVADIRETIRSACASLPEQNSGCEEFLERG